MKLRQPDGTADIVCELQENRDSWPPPDFLVDERFDALSARERAALWLESELQLDQRMIGTLLQPATIQQGAARILKRAKAKIRAAAKPPTTRLSPAKRTAAEQRLLAAVLSGTSSSSRRPVRS